MTNTMQHERETWPNVANTMQNAKWPCPNVANTMQNGRFWFQTVANTRQMVPGKKAKQIQNLRQKKHKLSYTQCLAHQRINMVQSNLNQRYWNTLMRFKQNRTNRKHAQTRSQKQQVLWECGIPGEGWMLESSLSLQNAGWVFWNSTFFGKTCSSTKCISFTASKNDTHFWGI